MKPKIAALSFFCFLLLAQTGRTQGGQNPFELNRGDSLSSASPSLTEKNPFEVQQRVAALVVEEEPAEDLSPSNPFEIEETAVPAGPTVKAPVTTPDPMEALPELAPPGKEDRGLLFWVILIMSLLMTVSVSLYRNILVKAYRACLNMNYLELVNREQAGFPKISYVVLFLFFCFSLGIFLYLSLTHFDLTPDWSFSRLLFYCIGAITLAMWLKIFVVSLIGWIFPLSKITSLYRFTIITSGIILGLILAFFNLLIAFSPDDTARLLLYGAFFALVLYYGFRIMRGFALASNYLYTHPFHFFLYLCTIEIAPILVILKLTGG